MKIDTALPYNLIISVRAITIYLEQGLLSWGGEGVTCKIYKVGARDNKLFKPKVVVIYQLGGELIF